MILRLPNTATVSQNL